MKFASFLCETKSAKSSGHVWFLVIISTLLLQLETPSPMARKTSVPTPLSTCWECVRRPRTMGCRPTRPTSRPCPTDHSSQGHSKSTTLPWHPPLLGTCLRQWTWVFAALHWIPVRKNASLGESTPSSQERLVWFDWNFVVTHFCPKLLLIYFWLTLPRFFLQILI